MKTEYVPSNDTICLSFDNGAEATICYFTLDRAYWNMREKHIERNNRMSRQGE